MYNLACVIRDYNPTSDTCSVEIQGIGIVDSWLDGVGIAPTVDRAYVVGGSQGVLAMPDLSRMCDATLIQVYPPGTAISYDPDPIIVYNGSISIPTDADGNGCADVTFPEPYDQVPVVTASAYDGATLTISNVTETGFTACVTGGKVSSSHKASYSSKSSKTTTPTKNKATTYYHNGDKVTTSFGADFEDSAEIDWTIDHATGPDRATISASLDPDFVKTLGGGASGPGVATYGLGTGGGPVPLSTKTDTGAYLLWHSCSQGDDVYLPTPDTAYLVIPDDGAGDYLALINAWIEAYGYPGDGSAWSLEWALQVDVYLSGNTATFPDYSYFKEDMRTTPGTTYEQLWTDFEIDLNVGLPGLTAGSKVAVSLVIEPNNLTGETKIWVAPENTWITLAPTGGRLPQQLGCRVVLDPGTAPAPAMGGSDLPVGEGAVLWASADFDTSGGTMWDAANPSHLVAPADGLYLVGAGLCATLYDQTDPGIAQALKMSFTVTSATAGYAGNVGGTKQYAFPNTGGTTIVCVTNSIPVQLKKDDYVQVMAGTNYTDATNPADWTTTGAEPCYASLVRLA